MDVLATARELELPDWFIGAGAIRDLVWDVRFGHGFDPATIADIDLVYFDPDDLSKAREHELEARLSDAFRSAGRSGAEWDVTNQAAVHTWFHVRFGGEPVAPLRSTEDGIATWPEHATCVGARLEADGAITVTAPHGLDALLDGVWSTNAIRVTPAVAARRLAKKHVGERWPRLRVR
jgi:hypothetical protein